MDTNKNPQNMGFLFFFLLTFKRNKKNINIKSVMGSQVFIVHLFSLVSDLPYL